MRILVRTVGLLLIALGTVLWARDRSRVPAQPTPVVVTHAPAPATENHRRRIRPHTDTATPAAPSSAHSESSSSSKVVLLDGQGRHYRFEVNLRKSSEWFDTKIPVTADLNVRMLCGPKLSIPSCENLVEASIGGSVFTAKTIRPNSPMLEIETVLPDQTPLINPNNDPPQVLHLNEQVMQTIKLRLVGQSAPDDLDGFIIKLYVKNQDGSHDVPFNATQQLELSALQKMGGK